MAQDPDPTATLEPTATAQAAVTPTAGATPVNDAPLDVAAVVWVNGRPARTVVQALIEDKVCAEGSSMAGPDDYLTIASLDVPSASATTGCGVEGATVHFLIDDEPANETVQWSAGTEIAVTLTSGPPFARFSGGYTLVGEPERLEVEPLIEGTVCGEQLNKALLGPGPTYGFDVVVDSEQAKPGCGRAGSTVTFRLIAVRDGSRVPVADAVGTATWNPGEFTREQRLVFSGVPIEALPVAGGTANGGTGGSVIAAAIAGGAALAVVAAVTLWLRRLST